MRSHVGWFRKRRALSGSLGKRVYVVGDIHGRVDLLCELSERIAADNARRISKDVRLIFLGDVIDRGPASREVVHFLREEAPKIAQTHFIMGNHEEVLLRTIGGETHLAQSWLYHGGLAFAESYGIPQGEIMGCEGDEIVAILRAAVPDDDICFLAKFIDYIQFGDYVFVHAGIRPGIPLRHQSRRDLHWIREPFLSSTDDFGMIVVHGHTVTTGTVFHSNRIGIDTGAYRSDILSALMIDECERSILQTGKSNTHHTP